MFSYIDIIEQVCVPHDVIFWLRRILIEPTLHETHIGFGQGQRALLALLVVLKFPPLILIFIMKLKTKFKGS